MRTASLLKRDRIDVELSMIYEYPLTIVEAPMGYGKTTAVKSFLKSERIHPLWISFHNSGNPGATFFSGFAEHLSRYNSNAGFFSEIPWPACGHSAA